MHKIRLVGIVTAICAAFPATSRAGIGNMIYAGTLLDSNGTFAAPDADTYEMLLNVYEVDAEDGNTLDATTLSEPVYTESWSQVSVRSGTFVLVLTQNEAGAFDLETVQSTATHPLFSVLEVAPTSSEAFEPLLPPRRLAPLPQVATRTRASTQRQLIPPSWFQPSEEIPPPTGPFSEFRWDQTAEYLAPQGSVRRRHTAPANMPTGAYPRRLRCRIDDTSTCDFRISLHHVTGKTWTECGAVWVDSAAGEVQLSSGDADWDPICNTGTAGRSGNSAQRYVIVADGRYDPDGSDHPLGSEGAYCQATGSGDELRLNHCVVDYLWP